MALAGIHKSKSAIEVLKTQLSSPGKDLLTKLASHSPIKTLCYKLRSNLGQNILSATEIFFLLSPFWEVSTSPQDALSEVWLPMGSSICWHSIKTFHRFIFSWISGPSSTKLGTKQSWVKGIQKSCSFWRRDNSKIVQFHCWFFNNLLQNKNQSFIKLSIIHPFEKGI